MSKDARTLRETGSRLPANRSAPLPAPVTVAQTPGASMPPGAGQAVEARFSGGGGRGFGIGPTQSRKAKPGQSQSPTSKVKGPKFGPGPTGVGNTGTGAPW